MSKTGPRDDPKEQKREMRDHLSNNDKGKWRDDKACKMVKNAIGEIRMINDGTMTGGSFKSLK